jgi:hypothetical protein
MCMNSQNLMSYLNRFHVSTICNCTNIQVGTCFCSGTVKYVWCNCRYSCSDSVPGNHSPKFLQHRHFSHTSTWKNQVVLEQDCFEAMPISLNWVDLWVGAFVPYVHQTLSWMIATDLNLVYHSMWMSFLLHGCQLNDWLTD